jgi:hypothetical protein
MDQYVYVLSKYFAVAANMSTAPTNPGAHPRKLLDAAHQVCPPTALSPASRLRLHIRPLVPLNFTQPLFSA